MQDIDDRAFDRRHAHRHPLTIHGRGQVVCLAGRHQCLRRGHETAGTERQVHKFGPSGADELDLIELGIGYAVQLERGVKSENAVGAQFARRGEAVDHHPVRRQMGWDRSEDLAADALDVASPQVMPEQAGDIGSARRMAEGRRELSPREDRVRG